MPKLKTRLKNRIGQALAVTTLVALMAIPVSAQQPIHVGGQGPNVEVDLSVLDNLGTAPNVAQMLRSGTRILRRQGGKLPLTRESGSLSPLLRSQGGAIARPAPRPASMPTIKPAMRTAPAAIPAAAPVLAVAKQPVQRKASATKKMVPGLPAKPKAARTSAPIIPAKPKVAVMAPPPPTAPKKAAPAKTMPARMKKPKAAPPAPKVPTTKVAALPPATTATAKGPRVSLSFQARQATLPGDVASKLASVIKRLSSDDNARVQLVAYAKGGGGSPSQARRLSLSRALAVRSYIMSKGIRSTRMDVRALGDQAGSEAADRVDVVLQAR